MAALGSWEKSVIHQLRSLYQALKEAIEALANRKVKPSFLDATNAYVDGYVPSKATGSDAFTWVAGGGGGGGGPTVAYISKDFVSPSIGSILAFTVTQDVVLSSVTLLAETEGNIEFDIWAVPYSFWDPPSIPDATNSICGGNYPTIVASEKYQDTSLSGWTVNIAANTTLLFVVTDVEDIGVCNLTLACVASASTGGVASVSSGIGIGVDNTDPFNPVINNLGVLSVVGVGVDNTDPQNPIINIPVRSAITFGWDGAGVALLPGQVLRGSSRFAMNLTDVTVLSDVVGSCVVDIWKDTFANYPPTIADSITGSNPPTLSASDKSFDNTLSGWTTAVAQNDTFICRINSISGGITQLNVTLGGDRA